MPLSTKNFNFNSFSLEKTHYFLLTDPISWKINLFFKYSLLKSPKTGHSKYCLDFLERAVDYQLYNKHFLIDFMEKFWTQIS